MGRGHRHRAVPRSGGAVIGPGTSNPLTTCVFDLDGTLLDSDAALVRPFEILGIAVAEVTFGHVLADECARLGISVAAYLDAYDPSVAVPFPGVEDLVSALDRWAVCSNKAARSGRVELARMGWKPEVALFTDDFGGPKHLGPVLEAMAISADEVIFVGDTAHDRRCAAAVGARFAVAAWNPRAEPEPGDIVLRTPADLLTHLAIPD